MTGESLSPDELIDLLVTMLNGVAGGREARWREVLGDVEKLNIVFNPRSNWRLHPEGSAREADVVNRAIDIVREAHPYVR